MRLEDLVGEHELSGVDFGELPPDRDNYQYESANTITFVLDGKAYCVTEDPSDGYRSSHRDIVETDTPVKNTFAPCRVVARYIDGPREYASDNDLLECIDVVTGKTVLLVGTENSGDYYPSYVANFSPENMAVNQPQSADAVDPQVASTGKPSTLVKGSSSKT